MKHSDIKRIVVIGGGSGASVVLRGASPIFGTGVTAVVNNFDDGGGTGKLRTEYPGLSAVGDVGKCAMAMSAAPAEVKELFNSRFKDGKGDLGLGGQTLRNLILAMASNQEGDDLNAALRLVENIFQVQGKVVAASNDNRNLRFVLPDGLVIEGEHNAEEALIPSFKGVKIEFDDPDTKISKEADEAIRSADMVVFAPGDLYTSLGPTLAVKGMREALMDTKVVVMISNLMNRNRHTVGFSTLDYADELTRIIGAPVIQRIIYNTQALNPEALEEQRVRGSSPVLPDIEGLEKAGYVARGADLLSQEKVVIDPFDEIGASRSQIIHSGQKVADILLEIYEKNGFGAKH